MEALRQTARGPLRVVSTPSSRLLLRRRRPRRRRRAPRGRRPLRRRRATGVRGRPRSSGHASSPSAAAPSSVPIRSRSSTAMTFRRPLCRRAIPSSSRSSSSGSMRTFESEPMQSLMPRLSTRSTGRNPSPRFASVVGQTQMRASCCASRSSSSPFACVACTTVVRGPRQPVRASSSIGRTPCSATHSSISRGCSSACTCSGSPSRAAYAPSSSSQSAGHARTEWGATPTRSPRREATRARRRYVGDRRLAEAVDPAARVGDVEEHELDAGLLRRVGRGAGLLEPEIVELADRRVAGPPQLAVDARRTELAHALGRLALRLGQHQLAPRPEVAAFGPSAQRPLERVASAR